MKIRNILVIWIILVSISAETLFGQVVTLNLDQNWRFRQSGFDKWMPATVPGCVHTDLLNNKRIEDPFFGTNEKELQWIGEKDWEYTSSFSVDKPLLQKENLELVFKGLDTYADVYLNDSLLFSADNMHREWRKACKGLLHEGTNTLRVNFKSVFKVDVPKYLKAPYKLQAWPNNDQGDMWLSLYARKAGYEYGWDWGPRLITSGIWRPVFIEGWNTSRIKNIQLIQQKLTNDMAAYVAIYEVESLGQKDAVLILKYNNKILAAKKVELSRGINRIPLDFNIKSPKLWWTNGLGRPNVYTFNCSIRSSTDLLDNKDITTGIRSLKVVRKNDKDGKSFYILLNGVPVFIKGSNYIPVDNFLNRATNERYEAVINSASDANMNMIRVWGGGIYENDIFYDLCDRKGILVWQDMMFACGMFPSDDYFIANVKQEVIENVSRLRNHPSIALWCGNNENEISWYGWGWKRKYSQDVQKKYERSMYHLFNKVIPDAISSVDTTRYYHPSSPSTGFNGVSERYGDSHYYGVWSVGEPFEAYNQHVARFMSEYGFQSFPELKSVAEFTEPADWSLNSPAILSHQRAKDNDTREEFGNKNIRKYMDMYFKSPKDFTSFLYVSQVLQAKGIVTAIEAHRRSMPFCMGTMYWQLNDCWPVASWSGTDYHGRWKALHYAVRDAYRKEIISVMNEAGKLRFYIASDRLKQFDAQLELKLVDFDGNVLSQTQKNILIAPNTSKLYYETDTSSLLKERNLNNVVLSVKLGIKGEMLASKYFYFVTEKELNLPKVVIKPKVIKTGNSYSIRLQSTKLAKSVFLSLASKEGFFSDNYFDLLPGEEKTINLKVDENTIDEKDLKVISLIDSY